MTDLTFPPGFLWGVATAAHQVEGNNDNSDWWDWELKPGTPCVEPSGAACGHYDRYREDIAIIAGLGFNTYRFSVEWARIEPANGAFDAAELDHYRRVVDKVRESGLMPMVTLNHFTLPKWVAAAGGWRNPSIAALFERYCRRVVQALGDGVDWYCTINEPGVVAFGGYLGAFGFPPGTRTLRSWRQAIDGLIAGHRSALRAIREVRPQARAGLTHSMQEWESNAGGRPVMEFVRRMNEDVFLEASRDDDFVGVQTYTRVRIELPSLAAPIVRAAIATPPLLQAAVPWLVGRQTSGGEPKSVGGADRTTQMGYEYRPEGIGATIRRAAEVLPGKDIVVTEHGVATDDEASRTEFIARGLASVRSAMDDGIPVRGYIYWSALDNFEWARGYEMRFGLIGVDRGTQERSVKASAPFLGEVARTGRLRWDPQSRTGADVEAGATA